MDLRFRRLFLLRFSLVLWCFYLVYVTGFLGYAVLAPDEALEARRRLDLEQQSRHAADFLRHERAADLVESLRHNLRQGRLDYFRWTRAGRTVAEEGAVPESAEIPEGQVVASGTHLRTRLAEKDSVLEFGSEVGWQGRARLLWRRFSLPWLKDFVLLGFSLGLVLYLFFRDLAKASARAPQPEALRLAPKSLRAALAPAPLSAPALYGAVTFAYAAESYAAALRSRYEFSRQLLARYGAEILSTESGRFLVSFPETATALGAARDLAREGAAVVLATGDGEAIWLSDQRTVTGEVWGRLTEAARRPAYGRVEVLDFAVYDPLFRVKEGRWLEVAVSQEDAILLARNGNAECLRYFRHDEDLRRLLESFAREAWDTPALLGALSALRSFSCGESSGAVAPAYGEFLAAELAAPERYRLGAALTLGTHLVPAAAVGADLEALFRRALAVDDPRTRANALEVFIFFFPEQELPEVKSFLRDGDNRLAGIALIKAALERLDERTLKLLATRIRSGTVAHAASALYALGEIAAHYHRRDPRYLATKEEFTALFDLIPALARHPNPMVRRQAVQAARKFAHPKVDERLRLVFEGCEEEDEELFATTYGWRKRARRAA